MLKHTNVVVVLLAALILASAAPVRISAQGAAQTPANVAGEWTFTFDTRNQAVFRGAIGQSGARLNGYMGDETAEYPITGTVDGNSVKIIWTIEQSGQKVVFTVTGKFDGGSAIAGRATVGTLAEVDVVGMRTAK
jgi:hypothetical protein